MEENGGQSRQGALKRYVREILNPKKWLGTCYNCSNLSRVCAEYKKVRADIKKRTAEAQRWQKKAKKIRSGMAGGNGGMMGQNPNGNGSGGANDRQLNAANQELLRAADAAQIDLNSRLALLQVTIFLSFVCLTPCRLLLFI